MEADQALSTLRSFNERVELILDFEMTQRLLNGESTDYSLVAPDDGSDKLGGAFVGGSAGTEGTHALANNVRLFLQEKEAVGIRRLAKIYESGLTSSDLAKQFRLVRGGLNDYLDQTSAVEIPGGTKHTKREYLEIYLFGDVSHTTKRKQYAQIAGNPLTKALSRMEFDRAVRRILRALIAMKDINEHAITELSQT